MSTSITTASLLVMNGTRTAPALTASWDINSDGRISRSEFERCYRAGGFYRTAYYNPDYWTYYWSGFDANGDGYLSADEYWSANAWSKIDVNHNGRIDANEWVWWPM